MLYTREQVLSSKDNDFICKRDALMETEGITLDGMVAYISGRLCPFATLWCPDDLARQASFSWNTIEHVITEHGGKFRS